MLKCISRGNSPIVIIGQHLKKIDEMQNYQFDSENKVWVRADYIRTIDYSDGADVEQRIIAAIQQTTDLSSFSDELETHIFDWPSRYFFSKKRANLLRPFAYIFNNKHILEPGCGSGSITRFLGECGAHVYAIEPNLQRARAAAARCRDLPNVKVFCDDIGGFQSGQPVDGIVVIGVLEYASKYGQQPIQFIQHLQQFLQTDGFMITAIENQLGLKYFAGFAEDHVGKLMYGINNNYQPGEVTTFGKKALTDLFESTGFKSNRMFLPFPDYKMPSLMIYPDIYKKKKVHFANILSDISWQDTQTRVPLFSLDKALPLIAENGLLYDLANSFCLFSEYNEKQSFDPQILLTIYDGKNETIITDNPEPSPQYELVTIVNRDHWRIEDIAAWYSKHPHIDLYDAFKKLSSIAPPANPAHTDINNIVQAIAPGKQLAGQYLLPVRPELLK